MAGILVSPPELRMKAKLLRESANRMHLAIENIDCNILNLNDASFSGSRANVFRHRYQSRRESLLTLYKVVLSLAVVLEQAADAFQKADTEMNILLGLSSTDKVQTQIRAEYREYIMKYANEEGVPYSILERILLKEKKDHDIFEVGKDWVGRLFDDNKVSLGLGQIEVRRAAELEFPDRDFEKDPLTALEQADFEAKLEDPEYNIKILAREMRNNYESYGKVPGKTEEDRWMFAIAKHKSGHGPIGEAQAMVQANGGDLNSWAEVSKYLSKDINEFVNFINENPSTPILPDMNHMENFA